MVENAGSKKKSLVTTLFMHIGLDYILHIALQTRFCLCIATSAPRPPFA